MNRVALLLLLVLAGAALAEEYQFVQPSEPLPDQPWHRTFIDENARTPEGQPNAGAAWTDFFLQHALNNTLASTAAQSRWEEAPGFLSWAVWGYLSPDSKFHGDERLLPMSQVWLDTLFKNLTTAPADPQAAAKWKPETLDAWNFADYTLPLLEIEARPALLAKLGAERVANLRRIVLQNIVAHTTPEAYNKLLEMAETYVNPATHPMAVFIGGWLLTGEQKYLQMAYRIIHLLGRDQLPNGMFPYRYKVYGPGHQEFEMMYYHGMNLRGLYLYWWATGSREAERIFRQSVGYYPLNLEWPGIFNGGPDIWWKDQWRTFWPHHVAMVAAVTGDGENAALAREMARRNISHDRVDLFLGAHAYQQMALRGVPDRPLRDHFTREDPDIRGWRLRHGRWAATFTTGSFTYTRASAMRVADDGNALSALHLARPVVRLWPLDKPYRTENDYSTLGRYGAKYVSATEKAGPPPAAASGRSPSPSGPGNPALPPAVALATTYSPALTAATWQETQPEAPWRMTELWLLTAQGLVGLIDSTATHQARELCHQFRFMVPGPTGEAEKQTDGSWQCGDLRFRVWDTDLPYALPERMRRYGMGEHDRRDWQLSLSDVERSPEHLAQDPPPAGQPQPELKLPELRDYAAGYHRYSLVEVSPRPGPSFRQVRRLAEKEVLGICVETETKTYLAVCNPTRTPLRRQVKVQGQRRTVEVAGQGITLQAW